MTTTDVLLNGRFTATGLPYPKPPHSHVSTCITLRPPRSFHFIVLTRDTGGAAHSCAAGHSTYDKCLRVLRDALLYRFTTYQDARRVRLVVETNILRVSPVNALLQARGLWLSNKPACRMVRNQRPKILRLILVSTVEESFRKIPKIACRVI